MEAPYAMYDKEIVYPVLKGEGARAGTLTVSEPKKLTIDFNCLGVEMVTVVTVTILIPMYNPVTFSISKKCGKENFLDRLQEKIVSEEERFGIIKILFMCALVFFLLYLIITCYNLSQGKSLIKAIPCGAGLLKCFKISEGMDEPETVNVINETTRVDTGNFSELSV